MNQTIVSLASAATIGSAMLLWKLFTGEHTDTDDAVEHVSDVCAHSMQNAVHLKLHLLTSTLC